MIFRLTHSQLLAAAALAFFAGSEIATGAAGTVVLAHEEPNQENKKDGRTAAEKDGQTAAGKTVELPPVEVRATAPVPLVSATTLDAFAAPQTLVGRDQIEDTGAMDIAGALRTVPGVTISRHGMAGSYGGASGGGVFVRGLGASRPGGELVTLYDGVPRFNPLFSHPLLDLLSVDATQKITVHKSPAPQIFGNGFAAISIAPRVPDNPDSGGGAEIIAAGGTHGTVVESVNFASRAISEKNNVELGIGQSYRYSKGHRRNAEGELEDYNLHFGYRFNKEWTFLFNADHTNNYAADPGAVGAVSPHMGNYHTQDTATVFTLANDYSAAGAASGLFAGANGHVKLNWHNGHAAWHNEGGIGVLGTALTEMDWNAFGIRARETLRPWSGGELIVGADVDLFVGEYRTKRNDGKAGLRFPREEFCTYSRFVAVAHTAGKRESWHVTPSAGARLYGHNRFGFEHAPHAGVVGGYGDTEFHATYARGVNYPGLLVAVFHETIMPPLANDPALRSAWRDLDAETLDHFEVGISHKFTPRIEAAVNAFYDAGRDRYIMQFAPGTMLPAGFANVGRYRNHGVEASVTWKPHDNVSVFAGGTWLRSSVEMPYSPEWSGSVGVTWIVFKSEEYERGHFGGAFRITADVVFQDSTLNPDGWSRMATPTAAQLRASRVPAFAVANLRFALGGLPDKPKKDGKHRHSHGCVPHPLFLLGAIFPKSMELFLNIENLTDAHYRYRNGYPMPGITVLSGVKFFY